MSNTSSDQPIKTMIPLSKRQQVPLLVPDQPLPPYTFVPGYHPHPLSDRQGHSFGLKSEPEEATDPTHWSQCRPYLRGIDLFNHGYYWEAHEAWESLWNACGRHGETANFIKGLIQMAVAGVKVRQGMPEGVLFHAQRACELFTLVAHSHTTFMGLNLTQLLASAREVGANADTYPAHPDLAVEIVFPFSLHPS
jgi:hypothetical protein